MLQGVTLKISYVNVMTTVATYIDCTL